MADDVRTYFSDRADDYARFRSTYPAEAIQHILEGLPSPVRVADIGCGTGIAARLLAAHGAAAIGVEPNAAMRAQAEEAGGGVRYVDGSAEETGLESDSLDLVVCAQAYHWFDSDPSLREFHRVLVPGGRIALMWNVRQDTVGFARPYAEIVTRAKNAMRAAGRTAHNAREGDPAKHPLFTNKRFVSFPNDHALTWDEVVGRSSSASYFPASGPLREELVAALRVAFDEFAQDDRVTLAQNTEVTLCDAV